MAALGIGTVACRVEYSYSKMQGSDNLSVIIQRASIYDKTTGRVFASGGERKPIYGVSISDPTKRLAMPKILLESAIPGTVVKVDDRVLGHCPVELSLEEGTHVVSFSWDKVPVSGERVLLTLKFGETKTITAGSSIGFVSIANMPEDGQVLVDSVKIDGRPKDLALKAGVHTVEISSIEFKTWKSQVAVEAGSTQRLEFVGEPALVGMVFVPGGKFDMGAKDVEGRPIRQVSVSSFYIGTYEITQGQYKAIVGTNPSAFANEIDAAVRPVENVSWFDAVEFCNKLSEAEGLQSVYTINGTKVLADHSKSGYRLPTEAEWEFAARGGLLSKNYSFSGSNDASMVAWYEGNSLGGTRATGMLDPNEIGLFDMSGNVWEWCADFYGPFAAEAQVDPQGPSIGENRVIRGGSWYNGEVFSRSAIGSAGKPATKDFGIGFRVLRRR
jgi:formylglycine-generating enzyme required for sulfatase activity